MANLNRFINKDKYLKFCELHKLEEFYAVVGSSFAALSLVEGLKSKNIIVFEKGVILIHCFSVVLELKIMEHSH